MLKILGILLCAAVSVESIVNGQQVGTMQDGKVRVSYEFPYIVQIIWKTDEGLFKCGGALIRRDAVLTAGHCVYKAKESELTVRAGIVHQQLHQDSEEIRRVKKIELAPSFRAKPKLINDIAILFLKREFPKTRSISPIAPPSPDDYNYDDPRENVVTAAGWGLTEHGVPSLWLRKTDLYLIPNEVCELQFKSRQIPSTAICALDQKGGTTCAGDSGGPLVHRDKIVGIGSFTWATITAPNGRKTCNHKVSAVFTKVLSFLPWISVQMNKYPLLHSSL